MPIVEYMVKNILKQFRHIERRSLNCVVKRLNYTEKSQISRDRGRHKKTMRRYL